MSIVSPSAAAEDLADLFEPAAVVVIGASDQSGNLGGRAVRLLRKFNYPGAIWPVNPRRATVADLPCYPSVHEVPGKASLAIIAVAAASIAARVEECAAAGIHAGIVWAAGFAEVGGAGVALQQQLVEVCRKTNFKLCGPNSIGIVNFWQPMTGSFASSLVSAEKLIPGGISMVSQSGGIGTAAFATALQLGFGFRYMVSAGNEAVLTTADYLGVFARDPETKVIAVYLEGVNDGPAFVKAMEETRAARKPVVMLKAGFSAASARAAKAHTGALAGDDRVWQAILREQAAIPVESAKEMLDVAITLSTTDPGALPKGRRVAVVGFGGGGGVLSTDLCARRGLEVQGLSATTAERLTALLPPIASVGNPIDLTPDMFQPEYLSRLPEVLDTIAGDANVDMLFMPLTAMARGVGDVSRTILGYRRRSRKPIFVSWTLAPAEGVAALTEGGMYAFPEPSSAIGVMGKLAAHAMAPTRAAGPTTQVPMFDWSRFVPRAEAGTVVSEDACHRLLAAAALSVAPGRLAGSETAAIEIARAVEFPVAMKGISALVTHRADAGLLALDLRTEEEVRQAYRDLTSRALSHHVSLDGLYIQHMEKGRIELLVSAFRDPVFGVMVVCGAGGGLAELLGDVTLERAPFDRARAAQVLERLRIVGRAPRLDPTAELSGAADFLSRFSELAATAPWKKFVLEVNPIKWRGQRPVAVDGLLIIEEP